MLDIDGGYNVYACVEQFEHVLPAFRMAARARDIGMRQLVDERHLGTTGEHGIKVHLLEVRPAVLDHLAGDDLETHQQPFGKRPLMRFHKPYYDVRPPFQAALSLIEHVVGFAYAGSGPEVNAKMPGGLDHRSGVIIFGQ